MVMNVARQADGKIRMQNAADAAAYSGATVMARAMNTLAFTNHLLCEVFAMTAFLREADSRIEADSTQDPPIVAKPGDAEQFVPQILDAWRVAAEKLTHAAETSPLLQKFTDLGRALLECAPCGTRGKIDMEQDLVDTFSLWAKQTAVLQLPLFEAILSGEMIPAYQRLVVEVFPQIAQNAAMETARRNGQSSGRSDSGRGDMLGVLWTGTGIAVSTAGSSASVLPVVDPAANSAAWTQSSLQRAELARHYLNYWNRQLLAFFDFHPNFSRDPANAKTQATMSQFSNIWRKFDCGYLSDLLNVEYPSANHLHQIDLELYSTTEPSLTSRAILQDRYTFLSTVYWTRLPHSLPGLFHDPTGSDAMAYAEARMFVPQPRLTWDSWPPGSSPTAIGGMLGNIQALPGTGYGPPGAQTFVVMPQYYWYYRTGWQSPVPMGELDIQALLDRMRYEPYRAIFGSGGFGYSHVRPDEWSLLNQNWSAALVPATNPNWNTVLRTPPALPAFDGTSLSLPDTTGLGEGNVQTISPH